MCIQFRIYITMSVSKITPKLHKPLGKLKQFHISRTSIVNPQLLQLA